MLLVFFDVLIENLNFLEENIYTKCLSHKIIIVLSHKKNFYNTFPTTFTIFKKI